MRLQNNILLLVVAITGINAARLAAVIPRDNTERAVLVPTDKTVRSVVSIGGWSLAQTSAATCPVDTPACGSQWCCPGTLDCIHTGNEDIGEVCCPSADDCSKTFKATPICADSSWTLWNATLQTDNQAGFFCCLQGQIGLQSGYCVDSADSATAGAPAVELQTGAGAIKSESSTGSSQSTLVSASTSSSLSSTISVTTTSSTSATASAEHSSGSTHGAATETGTATHSTLAGPTTASLLPPPASSTAAAAPGKSGAESLSSLRCGTFGGLVSLLFTVLIL